ncbi:MAG: hypothetical protein O6846_01655 [Thaumarchaeota archaeon]|nr:hypothetical protein [Nitrososphaerota archaeon]
MTIPAALGLSSTLAGVLPKKRAIPGMKFDLSLETQPILLYPDYVSSPYSGPCLMEGGINIQA